MSLKIFHQCGHNSNWNVDSFSNDGCGNGLILSPVHQNMDQINRIDVSVKQKSVFDPQYYLPSSQKVKLNSYPFFPETITDGFSTSDFNLIALESARKCLEFQLTQDFEFIIIPARFFPQMYPDYAERQEAYSVLPFLKEISAQKIKKRVFLTLPLTSHMVENHTYRTQILNWVTSFPEIQGVYLMVSPPDDSKQIKSHDFLNSYLEFIYSLKNADLDLVLGYLNSESLLLSLAGDSTLTFGTFENTRIFSIDKFLETEDRRGPKARIYLPGLMNWVQFGQAKTIRDALPDIWEKIHWPTDFSENALQAPVDPTFNQPNLYKHHFICFTKQIMKLKEISMEERYQQVRIWIKTALGNYDIIKKSVPMDFERHGDDGHLQPWLDAINSFYGKYLKG